MTSKDQSAVFYFNSQYLGSPAPSLLYYCTIVLLCWYESIASKQINQLMAIYHPLLSSFRCFRNYPTLPILVYVAPKRDHLPKHRSILSISDNARINLIINIIKLKFSKPIYLDFIKSFTLSLFL